MAENDLVHIGNFVEEWTAVLSDTDLDATDDAANAVSINISDDIAKELETVCGESTLSCPEEPAEVSTLLKTIPPGLEFATTGLQKNELEKRKDHIYWAHLKSKMKYQLQKGPWLHLSTKETDPVTAVTQREAIVNVRLYRPYFRSRSTPHPLLNQEFHVLGSQLLSQLRDRIECPADDVVAGDFSQCPDLPTDIKAKDIYKSGTFFIEDVFYNDMRHPNCRDYSRQIIEWSSDISRGVGPFTSQDMATTTFNDLHIRLGHPYLYLHQGDCEHLLIFSDVRLLHSEDCQDLTRYPLLIGARRERQAHCRICQTFTARWVTHESPLTPEDPCFFCDTCFRALHYGANGHNLVSFTAHPYVKDMAKTHTLTT
ncbi:snRNA-activating protein complex subunit 3 [Lamellibrachia satsuma]|nr:snRNA-activating protein complex subunit 3 [Lamellibrachia satsuma]